MVGVCLLVLTAVFHVPGFATSVLSGSCVCCRRQLTSAWRHRNRILRRCNERLRYSTMEWRRFLFYLLLVARRAHGWQHASVEEFRHTLREVTRTLVACEMPPGSTYKEFEVHANVQLQLYL